MSHVNDSITNQSNSIVANSNVVDGNINSNQNQIGLNLNQNGVDGNVNPIQNQIGLTPNQNVNTVPNQGNFRPAPADQTFFDYMNSLNPSRPNTLETAVPLQVRGSLKNLTRSDYVSSILRTLGNDAKRHIKCIQLGSTPFACRITFKEGARRYRETLLTKGIHLRNNFLFFNEAQPSGTSVFVKLIPCEVPDNSIVRFFSQYGDVKLITRITDTNGFETGDRRLVISLRNHIPSRLPLGSQANIHISYRGQPTCCHHCNYWGHTVQRCQLKRKCGICGSPHHKSFKCDLRLVVPYILPVGEEPDPDMVHPALDDLYYDDYMDDDNLSNHSNEFCFENLMPDPEHNRGVRRPASPRSILNNNDESAKRPRADPQPVPPDSPSTHDSPVPINDEVVAIPETQVSAMDGPHSQPAETPQLFSNSPSETPEGLVPSTEVSPSEPVGTLLLLSPTPPVEHELPEPESEAPNGLLTTEGLLRSQSVPSACSNPPIRLPQISTTPERDSNVPVRQPQAKPSVTAPSPPPGPSHVSETPCEEIRCTPPKPSTGVPPPNPSTVKCQNLFTISPFSSKDTPSYAQKLAHSHNKPPQVAEDLSVHLTPLRKSSQPFVPVRQHSRTRVPSGKSKDRR